MIMQANANLPVVFRQTEKWNLLVNIWQFESTLEKTNLLIEQ